LDYSIAPTLLGVDWTLSIEMFWYLLIPSLLLYVNSFRRLATIFVTSILIYALSKFGSSSLPLSEEDAALAVHWSPVPYALGFCFGIVAYRLKEFNFEYEKWSNAILVCILISGVIFLLLPMSIMNKTSYVFFTCISFALILFGSTNNKCFSKLFANRLVLFLGTISYGIYLCHPVLLGLIEQQIAFENLSIKFAVVLATSIGISTLTYLVIERRGLSMGKFLYSRLHRN